MTITAQTTDTTDITGQQLARALHIGPRTRSYVLRDEYGLPYDGARWAHVLSALGRSDITPTLSTRVHEVAYALNKCIGSARMPPVSALRIQLYTPYQLCALVAKIARECPGTTTHEICDIWLLANHEGL